MDLLKWEIGRFTLSTIINLMFVVRCTCFASNRWEIIFRNRFECLVLQKFLMKLDYLIKPLNASVVEPKSVWCSSLLEFANSIIDIIVMDAIFVKKVLFLYEFFYIGISRCEKVLWSFYVRPYSRCLWPCLESFEFNLIFTIKLSLT